MPETWPTCRPSVECSEAPPSPPADTNLNSATNTPTKEFDEATYPCKSNYAIENTGATEFKLACGSGGTYSETPTWDKCYEKCTENLAPATAAPDATPAPNGGASLEPIGKSIKVLKIKINICSVHVILIITFRGFCYLCSAMKVWSNYARKSNPQKLPFIKIYDYVYITYITYMAPS